jgi:tetratricopeptide (TPR) repeat protein
LGEIGADNPKSKIQNCLDGLAALVDQSLVRQDEGLDGEPRFTLLETIREYAWDQLVAHSELEAIKHRHATYYLTLAAAAESELQGPRQKHWMDRLEQEHANLRAVLGWAGAHGETELGLQLGSVLWQLWDAQGTLTEGRAHLSALLAQAQTSPPTLARIKVLYGAGVIAWDQGDLDAAHAFWDERLTLARELGDPSAIADALRDVGWITYRHGDATTGRRMMEESLAIHRNVGNQSGMWRALDSLAHSLTQMSSEEGDYATVRSLCEQSLAIVQELGDSAGIAFVRLSLGEIARLQGDFRLARSHYEQGLALGRALNDNYRIAETCSNLAYITLNEGDTDRAAVLFQESLVLSRQAERRPGTILCLVGLAGVASVRRQPECAAHLLGAATALLDATHLTLDTTDRRDYDRIVANVQAQLDEATFATAWAEGRAMPIAQAIAYALELPQ